MSSKVMSSTSASSDKTPCLDAMPMHQQAAFTYALYLHREELRKRQSSSMRISRTKLLLTHELITKTVKNISKCSADDLQMLSRETIFKKNLFRQIARMRQRQHMLALRHQQQQKGQQGNQQQQQQQTQSHEQKSGPPQQQQWTYAQQQQPWPQQQQSQAKQQQLQLYNANNSQGTPMEL